MSAKESYVRDKATTKYLLLVSTTKVIMTSIFHGPMLQNDHATFYILRVKSFRPTFKKILHHKIAVLQIEAILVTDGRGHEIGRQACLYSCHDDKLILLSTFLRSIKKT